MRIWIMVYDKKIICLKVYITKFKKQNNIIKMFIYCVIMSCFVNNKLLKWMNELYYHKLDDEKEKQKQKQKQKQKEMKYE